MADVILEIRNPKTVFASNLIWTIKWMTLGRELCEVPVQFQSFLGALRRLRLKVGWIRCLGLESEFKKAQMSSAVTC